LARDQLGDGREDRAVVGRERGVTILQPAFNGFLRHRVRLSNRARSGDSPLASPCAGRIVWDLLIASVALGRAALEEMLKDALNSTALLDEMISDAIDDLI
jgi:hypothetical protein